MRKDVLTRSSRLSKHHSGKAILQLGLGQRRMKSRLVSGVQNVNNWLGRQNINLATGQALRFAVA